MDNFRPMQHHNVIEEVLLPEAAVRLIMEDREVSRAEALKIHVESREFGNKLHPLSDDANPLDLTAVKREPVDVPLGLSRTPIVIDDDSDLNPDILAIKQEAVEPHLSVANLKSSTGSQRVVIDLTCSDGEA